MPERQATLEGERQAGLEEAAPDTCDRCGQSEVDVDVVGFGPLDVCKVCEDAHDAGRWSLQEVIDGAE